MKTLILGNRGLRLNAAIESLMMFYSKDAEHEVILDTPDIKANIMSELDANEEHVLFMRDHDVFTRTLNQNRLLHLNSNSVSSVCLSLGMNTDYSMQFDKYIEPPRGYVFATRMYAGEFNQQFGLDGYVYRTADIESVLSGIEFDSIAKLTRELSRVQPRGEYMAIDNKPCIAGIISIQEDRVFDEMKKKGKKINIEPLFDLPQNSMFVRTDYSFRWNR